MSFRIITIIHIVYKFYFCVFAFKLKFVNKLMITFDSIENGQLVNVTQFWKYTLSFQLEINVTACLFGTSIKSIPNCFFGRKNIF